jgi:hypothetical protein
MAELPSIGSVKGRIAISCARARRGSGARWIRRQQQPASPASRDDNAQPLGNASPSASSFTDVESLLADMGVHGAVCAGVTFKQPNIAGARGLIVECSGSSNGDTSMSMFDNHVDALAWSSSMLAVATNANLGPAAEVVGLNWAVNTSPAFAAKVVKAVGGQLLTS